MVYLYTAPYYTLTKPSQPLFFIYTAIYFVYSYLLFLHAPPSFIYLFFFTYFI